MVQDLDSLLFGELYQLSKESKSPEDLIIKIARNMGDSFLAEALNRFSFPPCLPVVLNACNGCYVNRWCVHRATPIEDKVILEQVENILTEPHFVFHENIEKFTKEIDKTDNESIYTMAEIIFTLYNDIMESEVDDEVCETQV